MLRVSCVVLRTPRQLIGRAIGLASFAQRDTLRCHWSGVQRCALHVIGQVLRAAHSASLVISHSLHCHPERIYAGVDDKDYIKNQTKKYD